MRQESELEIRLRIHFFGVERGKDVELVRIDHIDTGIGFLRDWFFLRNRVNSANGRCRWSREPIRQSCAFLSLVPGFPTVKAQIVIHAVFPFRWCQSASFLGCCTFPLERINLRVRGFFQRPYIRAALSCSEIVLFQGPCEHSPVSVQVSGFGY